MKKQAKQQLFIEALPLTTQKVSGIGHAIASLVRVLSEDEQFTREYEIVLFGPKSGQRRIDEWGFTNVTYKGHPVKQRIVTLLNFLHLLPPVDMWLGHGTYIFGNFTNYPLTRQSKSLTYIHDVCYLRHPLYVHPKVRRVLTHNVPTWIGRTDVVVTVSEHAKDEIEHFYPQVRGKVRVVPNGVDESEFFPLTSTEINRVKHKYGIEGSYLLFLSSIEPRKNLERLVLAYHSLPRKLKDQYALLIIGGDGWLNEGIHRAIESAVSSGDKIIRPDKYVPDEDLPALHSGATLLVHPAIYEGFGISPLQAMACGTPVLVSRTSSLTEVVGEAGEYIDNPEDVLEISQKLERLLTDKRLRVQYEAAGKVQAAKFSWTASARRLEQICRDISR